MEYDLSHQSVRSALAELQLKVKLLEDEKNHFQHLHQTTSRAFDDHRRELISLLEKERAVAGAREDRLRMDLQDTLAINTQLHQSVMEQRQVNQARMQTTMMEFRAERATVSEKLRHQVDDVYKEVSSLRKSIKDALEVKGSIEQEIHTQNQRQQSLHEEVEILRAQQMSLERRIALLREHEERRKRSPERPCRTAKVFTPSGRVDRASYVNPATHNIHAVVQTIEKHNVLTPRERAPTRSGRQLDAICRSMIEELLEARREYNVLAKRLKDPFVDSLETSRRLRQVMDEIDRKMTQLRHLRLQQHRIDDDMRMHELLEDILNENAQCELLHRELQQVLRATSA
jgi:chromosome segregation ATPase